MTREYWKGRFQIPAEASDNGLVRLNLENQEQKKSLTIGILVGPSRILVAEFIKRNPLSGSLFPFCNKQRRQLKILLLGSQWILYLSTRNEISVVMNQIRKGAQLRIL